MRVLVVEDETLVSDALTVVMKRQGWAVDVAGTVEEARWLAGEVDYDALVVDIHLPGGNGIDFCQELRAEGNTTPLLILTAQGDVSSRIRGLDSGADDYLPKPFSSAELCARLRALWRRPRTMLKPTIEVGDLLLHPASRSVTRQGVRIQLAAREFEFLHLLARSAGATVTRHEIFDTLWDFAAEPDANTLDVLVRSVRVKLDRPFATPMLLTVRGVGYLLDNRPADSATRPAHTGDTQTGDTQTGDVPAQDRLDDGDIGDAEVGTARAG